MKVVELYYSISEICMLLRFSDKFIRQRVKSGEFGPVENCIEINKDIRVPASGVNLFISKHSMDYNAGIKARNKAELRRKLEGKKQQAAPISE